MACASSNASTILIPEGTFPLRAVKLVGPCNSSLAIELKGTLTAPASDAMMKSDAWITINYVENFTLFGGGTLDGQGENDHKIQRIKLPVVSLFTTCFNIYSDSGTVVQIEHLSSFAYEHRA